jgi:hypothetical protein
LITVDIQSNKSLLSGNQEHRHKIGWHVSNNSSRRYRGCPLSSFLGLRFLDFFGLRRLHLLQQLKEPGSFFCSVATICSGVPQPRSSNAWAALVLAVGAASSSRITSTSTFTASSVSVLARSLRLPYTRRMPPGSPLVPG